MTTKHKHGNHYDLYGDVEKIKAALFNTAGHLKGQAGYMLSDSVETVKEQSDILKDNVVSYTTKKPFKTLSIALLIGIGIGYFIHK